MAPAKTFTREEVREHTSEDSLWCIIDSTVYDLSEFVDAHPGGESVLKQVAGQDATDAFYNLHRHEVLTKYADLAIGTVAGEKPQVITPQPGDLSPVPYAEPLWLSPPFRTPYYSESHRRLQRAVREFTDRYVAPEAHECETTGRHISQELIDRMSAQGILRMRLGPGKHLHGHELLGGAVRGEEFDYFHDLIISLEMGRPLNRGFQYGNMAGMTIGLTAVLNFAKDAAWRDKIADEVFSGKKKISLAITEAFAGSDVANLRTTAERTPDGKHFVGRLPACLIDESPPANKTVSSRS
jgi:predicted heme/steroid binding protein